MKKMLRFVGIAALTAVIGFGFASCDTGAGLTGERGPQGGQGLPEPAAPVPGAGLSLVGTTLRAGISIVDYAPNVAYTELGYFYSTITLQNTSTVRKYIDDIDYNLAQVSVVRVEAPVVVALSFTSIALEPGESVQFRIIPQAAHFTNNASNYADITIEGSYGAVTFERIVRLELTVGVDKSALEALIADAEGLLLATRVLPALAADRQHGYFYATQDAIDDLEDALEDAEEGLDDVIYYHNDAETRAEVLAGNAAVTALIGPLQLAIGTFERLRGNAHSVPMPGTFAISGAATRAIGSELVVTRENTTVPPIGEITFQWQRRVGGTGDWVIIPGAPVTYTFTPTYGMVRPNDHVRAVASHINHASATTNHVAMLAPAAPATVLNAISDQNVLVGQAVTVAVTGTNLGTGNFTGALTGDIAGITVTGAFTATGENMVLTVAGDATTGTRALTLTIAGQAQTFDLVIAD